MSSAPAISGVAHLTLPVHDLDEAQRFYVDLLGARLLRRLDRGQFLQFRPERAVEADADNSPLHLELCFGDGPEIHLFLQKNRARPSPPPHPHLALWVTPEGLDAFIERLRSAGVPLDGPRRLGPPGHASLYFADPWGNSLELVTLNYQGTVLHGPPAMHTLGHPE